MNTPATRRDFLLTSAAGLALPAGLAAADDTKAKGEPIKVVVWDERQPKQKEGYDGFLGNAIATHLVGQPGLAVKSVGLDDPGQGVSDEVLKGCRVLIWWGHVRQGEIAPIVGRRIVERIKAGTLSLIALHSAHWATPFMEAMNERTRMDVSRKYHLEKTPRDVTDVTFLPPPHRNTQPKREQRVTPYVEERKFPDGSVKLDVHLPYCCFPSYRTDGKPSQIRVLKADHPIAKGLPTTFEVPKEEMYDEPFHVPDPDVVVFEERWPTGEWFRSGMLWKIGAGWVFYFRPGHETFPVYKQPLPLQVITNAVNWLGSGPA
jgi:trehalose utilization protein